MSEEEEEEMQSFVHQEERVVQEVEETEEMVEMVEMEQMHWEEVEEELVDRRLAILEEQEETELLLSDIWQQP
jgi:hypothetical protein